MHGSETWEGGSGEGRVRVFRLSARFGEGECEREGKCEGEGECGGGVAVAVGGSSNEGEGGNSVERECGLGRTDGASDEDLAAGHRLHLAFQLLPA